LAPALAKLEKSVRIHHNLQAGFSQLYNFTSDEEGIRHPLLDKAGAQVDETDALYMLGSCAAFVSHLIPTTTQTECLTAIQIPGNPLRSFDISWVNPNRAEYYLGDRSNAGVDIIDTKSNTFKRTIPRFVGIKLLPSGAVDNNHSGPDGVTSHGRWLYAGDGDSTLKVIDLRRSSGSKKRAAPCLPHRSTTAALPPPMPSEAKPNARPPNLRKPGGWTAEIFFQASLT
jgi:hypothetical protein